MDTTALTLTHQQAQEILDDDGARCAHLVDAVLAGIAAYGQEMRAFSANAPTPYVVFSCISAEQVRFSVREGERLVDMLAYEYNPERMGAPQLERTDVMGAAMGTSTLTRRLLPLFDFALARLEEQVLLRVVSD
jgi:hypothetical protein